ncbi:YicC family protein [Compostibacter hankyongensis]|uniref:YicC family protein n=2 Tax=Compostibacter hankyongensis TaxID=1007089 RepID=A0ABP8G0J6_9BACT
MTGFGRAETQVGDKTISVDIKSLNGKQLDINLKMPPLLKPYEFDIRNLIQQTLQRGSVEVMVTVKQNGTAKPVTINTLLARQYYHTIASLAGELQLPQTDILNALLKLPEVVAPAAEELAEEEWEAVKQVFTTALQKTDEHRQNEGGTLEQDLELRIRNILLLQEKVQAQEPARRERIRSRLEASLQENTPKENLDQNRLEQELIYYVEKLDISEEQVRLSNHCRYFKEVLETPEFSKGKKLGFILQEVGREINTTGSKANDAAIQQWVVMMKDELEKAKEQVLNVL